MSAPRFPPTHWSTQPAHPAFVGYCHCHGCGLPGSGSYFADAASDCDPGKVTPECDKPVCSNCIQDQDGWHCEDCYDERSTP